MIEMPSCAGRTIAMLSLFTSYRMAHQDRPIKLFVGCSTFAEVEKVVEELRSVVCAYEAESGDAHLIGAGLPSARMLELATAAMRDADLAAAGALPSGTGAAAEDGRLLHPGVNSLDAVTEVAVRHGLGARRLAMHVVGLADVVVCSQACLLDPKTSQLLLRSACGPESVLVFEEAHALDSLCIEAFSLHVRLPTLVSANAALERLGKEVRQASADPHDERLAREHAELASTPIAALVRNLTDPGEWGTHDEAARRYWASTECFGAPPVFTGRGVEKSDGGLGAEAAAGGVAVAGNVRKASAFLWYLRRFVQHVHHRLDSCAAGAFEAPTAFLLDVDKSEEDFSRALAYAGARLRVLLATLEVADAHELSALVLVADFATLVATPHASDGFGIWLAPFDERAPAHRDPVLQLCCHDASVALRALAGGGRFRALVLTSGSLSPMPTYQTLLGLHDATTCSLASSFPHEALRPLVVARGADQVALRSGAGAAATLAPDVIHNYGRLLVEAAALVPDGVVVYFASYSLMQLVLRAWASSELLRAVTAHKLVFVESCDVIETTRALESYKRACDAGRGAVFLSSCRSKVARGVAFDGHYARAVLVLGFPFVDLDSAVVRARLEWLRATHGLTEKEFVSFDAMRHAAYCAGSALHGKTDYGVVILADRRFAEPDRCAKLPSWIQHFLPSARQNLSTDDAVTLTRQYLREMPSRALRVASRRLAGEADESGSWLAASASELLAKDPFLGGHGDVSAMEVG